MNSNIKFTLFFIVFLFVSACGSLDKNEQMSAEQPAAAPIIDATAKEPSATGEEESSAAGEESSAKEKEQQAKAKEGDVSTDEPIVMVQPLPITTIPEVTKMPADVTPETQPAPVDKPAEPKKSAVTSKKLDPNYYIVTVSEKNESHPSFGKGHPLGFLLDDVQGKTIAIRRGERYEFDVRTDVLHDVYFSSSPVGWGGGVVVDGIKGQFIYKGVIEITPNDKTPDVIYYQCQNHSAMGGKVFVVNKGTSEAKINKLIASVKISTANAGKSTKATKAKVSIAKLKQKMTFADMMLMSKGTQRVETSNNKEAKNMLNSAREKMGEARKQLSSGNNDKALVLADDVLRLIGTSSRLVPSAEVLEERNTRYMELLDSVKNFEQSHKVSRDQTVKARGKQAAVDYDKKEVASLIEEAKTFADTRKYVKAIPLLEKAENIVTSAINVMLDSQTIVYDLNFETAEEEYNYELKRFTGYEELVPIAIARKKPAPGAVKLMDGFVVKGRSQRDDAIKKAKQGDFPTAIAMMLSATTQVRRALRIAGVSQ